MLFGGEPDIEVVAEASTGREAIAKVARFHPTVVLMDIRMPELGGLEATRRILATDGAPRILILTTFAFTKRVIKQFGRLRRPSTPQGFEELTAREQEIFRLIAGGLSNAEIAEELVITDSTVESHIMHILQKLDLRDRVQLVVLAYQAGLV